MAGFFHGPWGSGCCQRRESEPGGSSASGGIVSSSLRDGSPQAKPITLASAAADCRLQASSMMAERSISRAVVSACRQASSAAEGQPRSQATSPAASSAWQAATPLGAVRASSRSRGLSRCAAATATSAWTTVSSWNWRLSAAASCRRSWAVRLSSGRRRLAAVGSPLPAGERSSAATSQVRVDCRCRSSRRSTSWRARAISSREAAASDSSAACLAAARRPAGSLPSDGRTAAPEGDCSPKAAAPVAARPATSTNRRPQRAIP